MSFATMARTAAAHPFPKDIQRSPPEVEVKQWSCGWGGPFVRVAVDVQAGQQAAEEEEEEAELEPAAAEACHPRRLVLVLFGV